MKKQNIFSLGLLSTLLISSFGGCYDEEDNDPTNNGNNNNSTLIEEELIIDISGLENLGPNYVYEGWIIENGTAHSAGIFTVDSNGNMSQNSFIMDLQTLNAAQAYVLTIEPSIDNDPNPSEVHILAGSFSSGSASLTIDHPAALGNDFENASGQYILGTPTDGNNFDENSGIWFLDPSNGNPSLNLPTLPNGWVYEGWVIIDGIPVTTGKFLNTTGADFSAPFSGNFSAPAYPGEDFLINAPTSLNFPLDLSSELVAISIEPVPDNSSAPFTLKPLFGNIPQSAQDHVLYNLQNIITNNAPTGIALK